MSIPTKTFARCDEAGHSHVLTFSCCDRLPLLRSDEICQLVIKAIQCAGVNHQCDLWAYVLMPEHVHLMVHPRSAEHSVSTLLQAIKRLSSYWAAEAGLIEPRRLWLPGPGFDKNLWSLPLIRTEIDYIHENPVRRQLCHSPEQWLYSSYGFWAGCDSSPLKMDRTLPNI
jgi:putative transposase